MTVFYGGSVARHDSAIIFCYSLCSALVSKYCTLSLVHLVFTTSILNWEVCQQPRARFSCCLCVHKFLKQILYNVMWTPLSFHFRVMCTCALHSFVWFRTSSTSRNGLTIQSQEIQEDKNHENHVFDPKTYFTPHLIYILFKIFLMKQM